MKKRGTMDNEGTLFDDDAGFINPETGEICDDSEWNSVADEEDEELDEDEEDE
jgi:hypothetical protein